MRYRRLDLNLLVALEALLIEQNVPFALKVADRYAVLKQGEIIDHGDAKDETAAASIFEHLRV